MSLPSEVDILIVGGGGCGLSLSIFLADHGVRFLTVERNAETTDHPRAHILNQRTMEIFAQHGIADAVYAEGAPIDLMARIDFRTSLGGSGPLDRKLIGVLDGYGGGALKDRYDADCAYRATNLPLMQLEPLLLSIANQRAPGAVRFGHELISFEQTADHVVATIRDHGRACDNTVRCRYLVACDGGKTVGRALAIPMQGPRRLRRMINTYFSADLSPYLEDDGALITYFINPDGDGQWAGGGLVKSGPRRWDRHSETWTLFREVAADDPDIPTPESATEKIRKLLRLPDLAMTVHKIGRWDVEGVVAEIYRKGRVFIAGDAAHRHPPVSALGLNTAFGDAHNLGWKLALVLKGQAQDALLDTYEMERQPVGASVAAWALNGFHMRTLLDVAIGVVPGQPELTKAAFERLFSATPMGETARAVVAEAVRIQRIGPQAHDMEIGYVYDRGAVVPDGTPRPTRDPMGGVCTPSTRPGCRIPHAWILRDGKRVSTHALVEPGRFTLIAEAPAWRAAAAIDGVDVALVGRDHATAPADGTWETVRQVDPGGAVLVRPDGHVAWRSMTLPADPARAVRDALAATLQAQPA